MAKKTFELEMNGIEIKTLEDLRENFNLEKAIEYFQSGKLVDWLAYRFYDEEVEALEKISAGDDNFAQKICDALNVICDDKFAKRVIEKKKFLAEKTDDENIIENATTTALNQDDLANLLHMDYEKIYLCGENFNIPISVENKKYIGLFSAPKIKIRANSDEELDAKNISFENCKLAWRKETSVEELRTLAKKIFNSEEWQIVDDNGNETSTYNQLSQIEKITAVNMICRGKYSEDRIAYMMFKKDFSDGFAFTTDAFCTCGASGGNIIKYNEIRSVTEGWNLYVYKTKGRCDFERGIFHDNPELNTKVKKFLDVVKNL